MLTGRRAVAPFRAQVWPDHARREDSGARASVHWLWRAAGRTAPAATPGLWATTAPSGIRTRRRRRCPALGAGEALGQAEVGEEVAPPIRVGGVRYELGTCRSGR